jgi:hypothetical protein
MTKIDIITSPQPSLDNLGRYYESEDYISHTDSKRSLFEKAYHFVKNIALKTNCNLSIRSKEGKILDIGAGTEIFYLLLCKMVGRQQESNPVTELNYCD